MSFTQYEYKHNTSVALPVIIYITDYLFIIIMTFLYLQIKAVGVGIDNLIKCEDFAQEQVVETAQEGGGGVNSGDIKWKRGEMEFEAMMRLLDSMVMWQFIGYISLCSVREYFYKLCHILTRLQVVSKLKPKVRIIQNKMSNK